MNQRLLFPALLLGATIALGGCKFLKKKAPEEAPSVAAAPASAAPAPVAPPPAPEVAAPVVAAEPPLDEATIPAPQDFEDEAFEKVTPANFKAELARLNKEITAK
jgi:hypothetical protein